MIRSVRPILCVEYNTYKVHPKPFSRHKQITSPQIVHKRECFVNDFLDTQTISGAMFGFE